MRDSGVNSMMESITTYGFTHTSHLTVCEPSQGENHYQLIDGAHRWKAVSNLIESSDPTVREKYKNFKLNCYVLPALQRNHQMALAAGI